MSLVQTIPSLTAEKKHIVIYDYMRFWGILTVVFGHSAFTDMGIVVDLSAATPEFYSWSILNTWRSLIGYIYAFHMPFFFILSGAVYEISRKRKTEKEKFFLFLNKKIKRLLIPFLIFGTLYMVPIKYFCGYYGDVSWWTAENLLLKGTYHNGHLWFLLALFWCFCIVGLIRFINDRFFHGNILSFGVIGCFVNYMLPYLLRIRQVDFYNLAAATSDCRLLCFLFGVCFEYCRERLDLWTKFDRYKILAFFVGVISYIFLLYPFWKTPFRGLISGIAGFFFFYSVSMLLIRYWPWHGHAWFQLVSRNFFGIYLWHDPLNYVILFFIVHYAWLQNIVGTCAMYILRFAGIFILSLILSETSKNMMMMVCKRKKFQWKDLGILFAAISVMFIVVSWVSVYSQNMSGIKSLSNYYLTDANWERGYFRRCGGFFVWNTQANRDKYQVGRFIQLPDKSRRKIITVYQNSGYLNVFTEGASFRADVFPHELKIEN